MTSDLPLSLFLLLLSLPSILALPSDLDVLLRLQFLASSEPSPWNPNHHCSWRGVSCDSRSRVTSIRLPSSSVRFRGKLSPSIGRLDALRVLALPFLGLRGVLPPEVAEMETLEVLDLRGNSLQGPLPARFGRRLRILKLGFNRFHGVIPLGLRECSELELLDLSHNRLGRGIPQWLGGMCKLRELYLSFNRFVGWIPPEIGEHCDSLEHLELAGNGLIGRIPGEIGQLRKLRSLDVSRNQLDGPVPPELGDCVHLAVIVLSNMDDAVRSRHELNRFEGGIDGRITGLPNLRVLWAPGASLSGLIPADWESCGSLEVVNLGGNQLSGELPPAFVSCRQLKHLNLSRNKLTGELDPMLPVPCLDVFDVSGNQLSGAIPNFTFNGCHPLNVPTDGSSAHASFFSRKLHVKESLRRWGMGSEVAILHDFGRNNFSGGIPSLPVAKERLHRQSVYALLLNGNKLSGPFPQHLLRGGEYTGGLALDISDNLLSGSISARIGSVCGSLMVLDASGNQLSGTLPFHLGLCNALKHLDFSRNQLQGRIPESLSLLKHLKHFSLAGNNITGSIPTSLRRLLSPDVLDNSSNSPFGGSPSEIVASGNLSVLNHNKLLTKIPMFEAKQTSISMFSEPNNISEPAPSSAFKVSSGTILGRVMLKPSLVSSAFIPSGNIRGRSLESIELSPPGKGSGFSSIEIASISSAAAIVSVLFALVVIYIYTRKCAPKAKVQSAGKKEVTVFVNIGAPLTYENVVRATGNFSASNCIGSGGFGATYKAEIVPGVIVAIKRLFVGKIQGVQQFHAEIKTLGRWRHPNLVTLIGFHVNEVEMFLIYNYLPGGNLEKFISTRNRRPVDWKVLHKIALNVACALAYLHDQCVPRILHRDVKPSNILLDNDFNAYLSDFGLARLLGNSETHATTGVAGTFGYVAPEYAMTCRVSDKADVYSYGVVLLELLSDKKALDPSFSPYGNGFNIVNWATMLLKKGRAREFFIDGLWGAGPSDDLIDTLHLALKCTVDSLTNRPTIKQVVQHLKKIQP